VRRPPSTSYLEVKPKVIETVIPAYKQLGSVLFTYAQGSLVEGYADEADLDLMMVWAAGPPDGTARRGLRLGDQAPDPSFFDQPGFVLDRFWLSGQQVDLKHVTIGEVTDWVEQVEAGAGTRGYPMPVIALHGLSHGDLLDDPEGRGNELQTRIGPIPLAFVTKSSAILEGAASEEYLNELAGCVSRGTGFSSMGWLRSSCDGPTSDGLLAMASTGRTRSVWLRGWPTSEASTWPRTTPPSGPAI
jgi:hypothetical protein